MNPLQIVRLSASNFKKLTAVEITPGGAPVITLTGENGAGKSSVLDAIMAALAGTKTLPAEPIRRGEENGQVTLDLGSLTIVRKFTPGGTTLRITDAAGHQARSPQAMLDDLLGNLAFDPLAFSRLRAAEQWEQLRELVGLDFTELDSKRARAYDDRTIINREILRLQTLVRDIPPSVDDAPDAETSAADVLAEITKAVEHNARIASSEEINAGLRLARDRALSSVVEAERVLENCKKELAAVQREYETKVVTVDAPLSVTGPKNQLAGIEQLNAIVRQKQARNSMLAAAKVEQNKSEFLTTELVRLDDEKKHRISVAKFPLPELSFDGAAITYRGIAFSQVSDGEKLRVSVAIGMCLNPKLRVIFVRDGSLLDKSGLQTIADLAKANEYQVWCEDSRSTDPTAIVIEDGAIKP